jgi:hypothetical protein
MCFVHACRDWKAGNVLWRQNVAAELTSAVFTEDSSCVLALGKGIFKVMGAACCRRHFSGCHCSSSSNCSTSCAENSS